MRGILLVCLAALATICQVLAGPISSGNWPKQLRRNDEGQVDSEQVAENSHIGYEDELHSPGEKPSILKQTRLSKREDSFDDDEDTFELPNVKNTSQSPLQGQEKSGNSSKLQVATADDTNVRTEDYDEDTFAIETEEKPAPVPDPQEDGSHKNSEQLNPESGTIIGWTVQLVRTPSGSFEYKQVPIYIR